MYHVVMTQPNGSSQRTPGIVPQILEATMRQRGMSASDLWRATGKSVSRATISLILSGKQPTTSTAHMAAMAEALGVSVDYLMGTSNVAEPTSLMLGELLVELTQVARHLSPRQQRQLLAIARSYQEQSEEARQAGRARLMEDVLSLVREYGGEVSEDRLIDFMEASSTAPTGSLPDGTEARGPNLLPDDILPDDEEEPPQGSD